MIVEDQLDRGVGRIGGIEKLEEFDEFAAAVAILDQGMNLAGDEIDPSQQTDRAVALIFMLACKGRMHARLGWQVRGRRGNGLYSRLLVVRDDRDGVAPLLRRHGRRLLQDFHLAINTQHLRHLLRKVRVAALQIVVHFVRFHVFLVEDFAHRALRQVGEAHMAFRRSMFAGVPGEKPRRPQFVRIADVLRLTAGQINQPSLGLNRDSGLAARPRAIIERCQRAVGHRSLNAALDGLVMQSERLAHCEKRGVFPIGQQYPRPLYPARRFCSRLRYRFQLRRIRICQRQFNRSPPRRHLVNPSLKAPSALCRSLERRINPLLMTTFMESMV